jgi:hypothetical protein
MRAKWGTFTNDGGAGPAAPPWSGQGRRGTGRAGAGYGLNGLTKNRMSEMSST